MFSIILYATVTAAAAAALWLQVTQCQFLNLLLAQHKLTIGISSTKYQSSLEIV